VGGDAEKTPRRGDGRLPQRRRQRHRVGAEGRDFEVRRDPEGRGRVRQARGLDGVRFPLGVPGEVRADVETVLRKGTC